MSTEKLHIGYQDFKNDVYHFFFFSVLGIIIYLLTECFKCSEFM